MFKGTGLDLHRFDQKSYYKIKQTYLCKQLTSQLVLTIFTSKIINNKNRSSEKKPLLKTVILLLKVMWLKSHNGVTLKNQRQAC